jgi:hypothetical protein
MIIFYFININNMSREQANAYLGNMEQVNAARNANTMSGLRQLEQGKITEKAKWLQSQQPKAEIDTLQKEFGVTPDMVTGARGVVKFGKNLKSVGAAMKTMDEAKAVTRAEMIGGKQAGRAAQIMQEALKGGQEATSTVGKIVQPVVEGGKDILRGASTGKGVLTALTTTGEEVGGAAADIAKGASFASKAIEGAGSVAAVATGGLAVGKDIEGLIKGESLGKAMGDNTAERVANVLEIGGSALSFIPGLDVLGGVAAAVGGILDFFGEKSHEAKEKKEKATQDATIDAQNIPTASGPRSAGMASLGMVSNMSRTAETMSHGSGVF